MEKQNKKSIITIAAIGGIIFILVVIHAITTNDSNSQTTQNTQDVHQTISIGDEAYLRLPNISDPEQVLILGPTPEVADEIGKALLAKDWAGLLALNAKGAFGVSNGTKVKIIDKQGAFSSLYQVRIIEGVRPVDEDKVSMAGWLPAEFVSKQ